MVGITRFPDYAYTIADVIKNNKIESKSKYKLAYFFSFEKFPELVVKMRMKKFDEDCVEDLCEMNSKIKEDLENGILDPLKYATLAIMIQDNFREKV